MGDAGTSYSAPTVWGPQKHGLTQIYNQAQRLAQQPQSFLPPGLLSYLPNRDPAYAEAINRLETTGREGSPLTAPALDLGRRTLGGAFLGSNPYLDSMYDQAASGVTRNFMRGVSPAIEARFAGQTGSPQYQAAIGDARRGLANELGGMAANIYGSNYDTERGRQTAMLGMAPSLGAMNLADIESLRRAGAEREQYQGAQLEEQRQAHEYAQNEPWARLQRWSGLLGQPITGTTSGYGGALPWLQFGQGVMQSVGQLGSAGAALMMA